MPGAPWFWRTCFSARCRLVRSNTLSSNVWGGIDLDALDSPTLASFCSTAGLRNGSVTSLGLFIHRPRRSSFGPSAGATRPTIPFADFSMTFKTGRPDIVTCHARHTRKSKGLRAFAQSLMTAGLAMLKHIDYSFWCFLHHRERVDPINAPMNVVPPKGSITISKTPVAKSQFRGGSPARKNNE